LPLAKDPKVGFQFLINPFGLAISLRVVGSRKSNVIGKESGQFLCKGRGKLWTMVQDDFVVETKAGEDIFEKQSSNTSGIDGFGTRDENHPLYKPMVDHDQNRVKLEESRRSMIISQEICWNRWEAENKMGLSPGTVG